MRGSAVLRAALVAAVGAGAVTVATIGPQTRVILAGAPTQEAAAQTARPVPVTSRVLVCGGQALRGVDGISDAGRPAPPPVSVLSAMAPAGLAGILPAGPGTPGLTARPLPFGSSTPTPLAPGAVPVATAVTGATALQLAATGSAAATLTGAQRQLAAGTDSRGLAAAPCGTARADSWIVGGGGEPGRQERLVLTNPNPTAISVDVTAYGERGPISSPNGLGIAVGAHERRVVLLDAIDNGETAPVFRVQASGGVVHAQLHDSWLDGIVPRGEDDTVATAGPATAQVVPGVTLRGNQDHLSVRVAVPGQVGATVTIRSLGLPGQQVPAAATATIKAGGVKEVELPDASGALGLSITSSAPVVASALVTRGDATGGVQDFAWVPATPALTGPAGLPLQVAPPAGSAVPAGSGARLVLSAPAAAQTATVSLVDAQGAISPQPVRVGADSSTNVDLTGATAVWVTPGSGALYAAVVVTQASGDAELVAALPLESRPQQETPPVVEPLHP